MVCSSIQNVHSKLQIILQAGYKQQKKQQQQQRIALIYFDVYSTIRSYLVLCIKLLLLLLLRATSHHRMCNRLSCGRDGSFGYIYQD